MTVQPRSAVAVIKESEADFQVWVIDLAHRTGWRVHHDRAVKTPTGYRTPIQGDEGFPDLVLARHGVVLFVELKSENGRMGPGQNEWRISLDGPGTRYVVWRPSDRERIKRVLGSWP